MEVSLLEKKLQETQMHEIEEDLTSAAKELFKKPCNFVLGAVEVSGLPPFDILEIAFAGRSNVGKSSLLNAITSRRNLARASKTPGRTREINFFSLDDKVMIADLPGYGYAKADKKSVEGWNKLVKDYLIGRPNLRQVFLLIDSRHGLKNNDKEIMSILDDSAVSYQLVLTKLDKQKKEGLERVLEEIRLSSKNHPAMHPEVVFTSSAEKLGLNNLKNIIASL